MVKSVTSQFKVNEGVWLAEVVTENEPVVVVVTWLSVALETVHL